MFAVRTPPKVKGCAGSWLRRRGLSALNIIPHLRKDAGCATVGMVTATGMNAQQKAAKFGFTYCATDYQALLADPAVDAIFIATRHRTHADFVVQALDAGKHVSLKSHSPYGTAA